MNPYHSTGFWQLRTDLRTFHLNYAQITAPKLKNIEPMEYKNPGMRIRIVLKSVCGPWL